MIAAVKRRGEKYHSSALALSRLISSRAHEGIASALALIELPAGLASSTHMPIEKIYEVASAVQQAYHLRLMPFEPYIESTVSLAFEFRDLKRRWEITSADLHHLATAIREQCAMFVAVDERHLLRTECREAFRKYVEVLSPAEAVDRLT